MFNKMLRKTNNTKGFTMIELIIVIAIVAILAAVLIPRFAGFRDQANQSAVDTDARNLGTALTAIIALDNPPANTNLPYSPTAPALAIDANRVITWSGLNATTLGTVTIGGTTTNPTVTVARNGFTGNWSQP